MAKNKFLRKLTSPMIVLNVLALVLFFILLWFGSQAWMNHFTHHGEGIEVPDLVNRSVKEAELELESLSLQAFVVDSVYDKQKPAGIVLDQKPAAGAQVKMGRQIYLTINKSAIDKQPLPAIIGNCTMQQAQEILIKNGFLLGPVEYIKGDKDILLGVKQNGRSIANGQTISPDVPLTLLVGEDATERDEFGDEYENSSESDVWDNWDN